MILLAFLSMLVAVALLVVLTYFVTNIVHALEEIGAREPSFNGKSGAHMSHLARIRYGVRAIEKHVRGLPPQATRLNENLASIADRMADLERTVAGTLQAVENQRR